MRRLAVILAAVATAVAAAALPSGAAQSAPTLADFGSNFPDRAYTLTLPQAKRLTAADVKVTENGETVNDLAVIAPGQDSATVLAIDASNSMAGKPIQEAMKAARAFAANRVPNARLGVVYFNDDVVVALSPTRNGREISAVLARPPKLSEKTHIYDALGTAVDELQSTGARLGSVVLLTDGDDVGSSTSEDVALGRLKDANVRVFGVGLKSPAYTPATLQTLANETGGAYADTSSATGLSPILSDLGYRLANEYLLLYRSLKGPEKKVAVNVAVKGYEPVAASYTTPALGISSGPAEESAFDKIVQSWFFMLLLVLVIIGLLIFAFRTIFDPQRDLRQRMSAFVDVSGDDAKLLSREELSARVRDFEQSIERSGRLQSFAEECDVGMVKQPPSTLLLGSFAATAILSVILAALWSPFWLILFPLGPVFAWLYVRHSAARQRKAFGEQLPDNLDVLAQALRVGHSLVGGLATMAEDAAEPSRREFKRVVTDEQLGIPLEDSMKKVAVRMQSHDMEHVALVAMLQRETGGASAEVIDQISENIRGRMEVRRLVRTLTAQGRLARWIVSAMPIFLVLAIYIIFPQYLDPLFHKTVGQFALVVAAILVVMGSLAIKRIVEIKV